ncbi:MAG: tetratricopeptide repeat protein [Kofleriaceae bacterium]
MKLTDRSRPAQKREAPPEPTTNSNDILQLQLLLGPVQDEQIELLKNDLIKNTPDSDVVEKSDYLFRLANIYAKQNRAHRLKTIDAEIALAKADPKQKAALTAAIADHKAKAKASLIEALRTYQQLTDNQAFVNAPNIDSAVFYFAYTLQTSGYMKEARAAYDKLLKNYPKSKYVAEAHLAFAEYHFELRQLAEAESRYRQVLKFPQSSVYTFAQYKLGWVSFNLGKFADALQVFNDVAQATRGKPDKTVLYRAAKHDFVRAYAEIGKADKALPSFKRVGNDDGIGMLATLADLYLDQGKSDKAIFVYRQLMTERPNSPNVCVWEHSVARAMLTIGTGDDKVKEIEQLVKLYKALRDNKVLPKAEAIECRDAAAEMSGQLARAYHQEGVKTKNAEQLGYAGRLYRAYLAAFQDAPDYGETSYYHAELAWVYAEMEGQARLATVKWEQAANAFTEIVERGKLDPKLVKISADAAMLARMKMLQVDPRVHQQAIDDAAYEHAATPKPIPEPDQKLVVAYDLYLKYVKDPNDSERIDVLFHKANLLRRYDHLGEAIPVFEEIVAKHPDHEAAEWSAQLVLDSHNRLRAYDAMFTYADKLPKAFLTKHPELAKTVELLKRQGIAKQAGVLEEQAKKSKNLELYVACGDKYLQAYNSDPLDPKADVLLYNAGVCYEDGRSLSAAIGVYRTLQQLFPKSTHTARSLARLGNVYASVAYHREAAETLEQYATKYALEKDAYRAYSDAVQFRKGIGDDDKAIADTKKFIAMFGKVKPAEAATAYFSMASIYEKQGDLDKLAAHLRSYLDLYGATGGTDRRIIASAKLGQALWQAACPVPTVDGACMKIARVASISSRKLRVRTDAIPKRCGDEDKAEVTMVPRDPRRVTQAMAAFAAAIKDYETSKPTTGDVRGALYHYALARFGKLERDYEAYLALPIPANLDFDARKVAIAAQSRKRFTTWFDAKFARGTEMRKAYESVIELKDGAVSISAAARLGAIMQNFSVQLFRAEIPANVRSGPYAEEASQSYCDELTAAAEPLQKAAENSYEGCLATSTKLGWFSEWSRACERELGQLMPGRYPKAFEVRRSPDAYALIVDTEGAPKL